MTEAGSIAELDDPSTAADLSAAITRTRQQ